MSIFSGIMSSENDTKGFPTDRNFVTLFRSAFEDEFLDIIKNDYPDLFFTNMGLGYRSRKSSGGLEPDGLIMISKSLKNWSILWSLR